MGAMLLYMANIWLWFTLVMFILGLGAVVSKKPVPYWNILIRADILLAVLTVIMIIIFGLSL